MKNILSKIFKKDTTTRYEVDGSLEIIPEEWNEGEKICKYDHKFRALVHLHPDGTVQVKRMDQLPTDNHRYKQLFCENGKGYEVVVRETQEKYVIRMAVTKFLTWREVRKLVHSCYLIVAQFLKNLTTEH